MKRSPDKTNKKQKENFIFHGEVLVSIDYGEIRKISSIGTDIKSNKRRTLRHDSRRDHSDSIDSTFSNDGFRIGSYGHFSSSTHGSMSSNFTSFDDSGDECEVYDEKFDCAQMKVTAKSGMLIFEFPEQESRKPAELSSSSISNASSSSGSLSTLCTLCDDDCPSDGENDNKEDSSQNSAFPLSDTNLRKSKNVSLNLLKNFIQIWTNIPSKKESALKATALKSDSNPRNKNLLSNLPIKIDADLNSLNKATLESKPEKTEESTTPRKKSKNLNVEKRSETNSSPFAMSREIHKNDTPSCTSTIITCSTSKSHNNDLDDNERISKIILEDSSNKLKPNKSIKILLSQDDEIHASPCQCALQLVGLVSASPPRSGAKTKTTKNIPAPRVLNYPPAQQQISANAKRLVDDCSSQGFRGTSTSINIKPGSRGLQGQSQYNNDINMVRTSSGKYQEKKINEFNKSDHSNILSAELHHIKLGGPIPDKQICLPSIPKKRSHISLFPKMSSPAMLSTLHEITILRSTLHLDSNLHDFQEDKGWKAITIRCNDHDEMDSLIQALRSTSRSRVIPFSPKPKAKIMRSNSIVKPRKKTKTIIELNHPYPSNRRKRLLSSSSSKQFFNNKDICELCNEEFTLLHRRHHCRKCYKSCCSTCSSIYADQKGKQIRYCKSCKRINFNMHKKPGNRFHNRDHCELCTLHFTILTRRHHCRKCNRSCCSDCSSIFMAKGGEVTRYCNLCNKKMRNISPNHAYPSLPGKVHEECNKLGVGVMGKIPHWINFMKTDDSLRPAVARLTIELIEAIALPTLDFYGKIDPYVRATITGYDYDLKWNLIEWFKHKQFSLCSIYCSGTSSPVWLGPGRRGGELLTLPVLRT